MKTLIIIIVILLLIREVLAVVFGWSSPWFGEIFENAKYNRQIEKKWRKDGEPIVSTTVGWRPDPYNKEDGYRHDPHVNGQERETYSKLLRGGTKQYREKFAKDIEKSKQERNF